MFEGMKRLGIGNIAGSVAIFSCDVTFNRVCQIKFIGDGPREKISILRGETTLIAGLLQAFCTVSAWKMLCACTCFFTTSRAILRMEKTDALSDVLRSHLFLLFTCSVS